MMDTDRRIVADLLTVLHVRTGGYRRIIGPGRDVNRVLRTGTDRRGPLWSRLNLEE